SRNICGARRSAAAHSILPSIASRRTSGPAISPKASTPLDTGYGCLHPAFSVMRMSYAGAMISGTFTRRLRSLCAVAMVAVIKKLGRALIHPDRALRRCCQALRQVGSRRRIRRATRSLQQRRNGGEIAPISASSVSDYLGVIISYKITRPQRIAMLADTLQTLKGALHDTAVPIRVIDASDPSWRIVLLLRSGPAAHADLERKNR